MIYLLIQYIVFAIISISGFYFLFTSRVFSLKNPLEKNQRFILTNKEYLLLFIFATSIISCGGSLMATRLLVNIVIVFCGILLAKGRIPVSPAVVFYFLYLLWLIVEIIFSPARFYGIRVFLKYLYPFFILIFASTVTSKLFRIPYYFSVLKLITKIGLFGIIGLLLLGRIPIINNLFYSLVMSFTAILDFFPVVITISLLLYSYTKKSHYLILVVLCFITNLLLVNRTGLLAASITVVVFSIIRYKVKSLPFIFVALIIFVGSVIFVPSVREKMFKEQLSTDEIIEKGDELSRDDIDSSGRFAMWEWSLENFYKDKELMGSGLGTLQYIFYSHNHPFGQIEVVHNDYIQILCDTGVVGLLLYVISLLSIIIHSLIIYYKSRPIVLKIAGFVSGVSLAGMLSTLYTDNVVNYSLMTLSFPFALYGLTLGLKSHYEGISDSSESRKSDYD